MLKYIIQLSLIVLCILTVSPAHSRPYHGDLFTFHQPDGQEFPVHLFGDEYYVVLETPDGYTLTKDESTGFYYYAIPAADGMSFVSTGINAGEALPPTMQLKKNGRLSRHTVKEKSNAARKQRGVDAKGRLIPAQHLRFHPQDFGYERWAPELEQEAQTLETLPQSALPTPPSTTTTGTRIGLVLLAQFPDLPGDVTISEAQVDAYANDPSYTEFNNATSVYGYFDIQSNGNLTYNCIVTAYFTAANNRDYYTDSSIAFGTRAKELINEGLTVLQENDFDFTKVDGNSDGVLDGVNLFYAGSRVNNWSEGLWPHKWSSSWTGLSGTGLSTSFQYQITDMGSSLSLGTFCHENGHMICKFPDLYSYSGNAANVGAYSLMHTSGTTHPRSIDAYLKIHAGWSTVIEVNSASHLRGAVEVDKNAFYQYRNPSNSMEYFLLSVRADSGYEGIFGGATSATNPTDGLVIWHAYENGSNTYSSIFSADNPADYSTPYELMVVEANPSSAIIPWYNDPTPASNDAYHSADISEASDFTLPALKFWDTSSGRTTTSDMRVHSVGDQGEVVTFTLGSNASLGSPAIGLTSVTLAPTCNLGANAPSQKFAVFNSGGGTLSYTLSNNASSWLTLSPTSGTATTEADQVTVTYTSNELSSGTYNGTITITDTGATNSPQTIPVTLTVQPQASVSLDLSDLNKTLQAGEQGADFFTISNGGGGTLFYTLSESADWLQLAKSSGTVALEEDTIEVVFDATGLFDGTYNATILIDSSNADNTPQTIDVSLTVIGDIALTNPDGDETLWRGNKHDIRWLTGGNITGNVAIDLYKGGTLHTTLAASTENDGFYSWDIAPEQTLGTDYTIRITSINEPLLSGESITNFSVTELPALAALPYNESFESSLGVWQQKSGDNFDWTRNSGSTPSSGTGPSSATDGSWYIFTESSTPNYPSQSAVLEAYFDLRSSTAPIMTFANHMYGATMGELQIRASSDQDNWTTLFHQSGDQGNVWHYANADLSSLAGKAITVQLIGLTGSSYTGDMALDNLTISESSKTLAYSSHTFSESSSDDGSIANSITITLSGDTYTATAVSGGYITADNVPDGLTAEFIRDSSSQISFSLNGNATNHAIENSFQHLTVHLADGAFTAGDASAVTGSTQDIQLSFSEDFSTPAFSINNPIISEGNSGTTILHFTVTLSRAPGTSVTVEYATADGTATAGTDYTAASGQLSFAATETSKTFDITVNGDYYDENNETFFVTLSNNSIETDISAGTGMGTLNDDDTAGIAVSSISGNTTEDGGTATFTVVLNSRPLADVTIGLSSDNTNEGTVSPASLNFTDNNWDSEQTVVISGVNDPVIDGDTAYTIITALAVSADANYSDMNPSDVVVINENTATGIFVLDVVISGNGSGTVTSNPPGIHCGIDCSAPYNENSTIDLIVTPDTGSVFGGWSGDSDCSDAAVTLDSAKSCTATFKKSFQWFPAFLPANFKRIQ
ncbi:MAG: M6 family metalloprotease domain-containing protein [Proteobacteria bacterium]|nr:M6 family metalloprotease domain-containing protein [Pseudomonadota bacterium]